MSASEATFTIGVEEEYQIIDPQTWELSSSSRSLLHTAQQALGESAQHELQLSQVEAATPVCRDLSEVRAEVRRMRGELIDAAAQKGKYLVAAGTHPFSHWKDQRITPKARYREISKDYQQLAREPIFGCHIHVGITDRAMGLQVMNRARLWLAPLLALSANSPYWQGEDTGYASFRSVLWSRWPTSGQPQHFESLEEYDDLLQAMIEAGCIEDATKIYWDLRLSERFQTLEFRVADCCLTLDETVMLAGLVQALVQTCYAEINGQFPLARVRPELLRVAHWRAARYGLEDGLIDAAEHRLLPADELIEKLLTILRGALEEQGTWTEVAELVHRTVQEGNGSMRQRAVYQRDERMEDLVQYMVEQTRQGI